MRILLVDDDPDLTESIASMLRLEGHQVQTASDGSAALRAARGTALDAVLLDLNLPDMHGFDIAHAFRTGVISEDVSIIVITGAKSPALAKADEAGVDLLLSKPVDSEHLGGLVEYITRRRHSILRSSGSTSIRCLHWS